MRSFRSEGGFVHPRTAIILGILVVFVWSGIGYMDGTWTAQEFKGQIRDTILSNPRMKQDEFVTTLTAHAGRIGVVLDVDSISIERGGQTMLSAGGISGARMSYTVPYKVAFFSFERDVNAHVVP